MGNMDHYEIGSILTEHQSACRAAHEQVQLLQHLYARLTEEGAGREGLDENRRMDELRADRQLLVAKLKALGLLRTKPDPEREGLLDLASGLMGALSAGNNNAANERLVSEEREFMRLCEQLAAHDDDARLIDSVARTRAAIERLG